MSDRESIYSYRDADTGREVRSSRPPFVGDPRRQEELGIDVGMCPACKRGGVPRRWNDGNPSYFPHSNDGRLCSGRLRAMMEASR